MLNVKQFGIASAITLALCGTANAASVTYDYIGNDFDFFRVVDRLTFSDVHIIDTLPPNVGPRITGSATFADGIDNPVTSYFLTDGLRTVDNSFSGINSFIDGQSDFLMTFINNNVESWEVLFDYRSSSDFQFYKNITLFTNSSLLASGYDFSYYQEDLAGESIRDLANSYSKGTWTLREEPVSAVPVPAALPLMASALGLFGFIKRRNQSV